jgi:hypothetical protein
MSQFQFRQVKGQKKYKSWKEWLEGDIIIGVFKDTYIDKYKKNGYTIEIIETQFQEGEDLPAGTMLGLNGMGSLDYKMEDVAIGSVVRIEYTGKTVLEKGPYEGKEAHTVSVAVSSGPVEEEGDYDDL